MRLRRESVGSLDLHVIFFPFLLARFTQGIALLEDPLQLQQLLFQDGHGHGCGSDSLSLLGMKAGHPNWPRASTETDDTLQDTFELAEDSRTRSAKEPSDRRFFVWLSDVHVDPLYGSRSAACTSHQNASHHPSMAKLGCDPSLSLWASSVEAAARFGHAAEFVLTTGDHARHQQDRLENPSDNVTSIMFETARILSGTFAQLGPERFLTGSHGNDDSPTDYGLNITSDIQRNPWLSVVAAGWREAGVMTEPQEQAFSYGGFFETEVGGLRALSINTIIYSVQHTPSEPEPEDPFGQFAWLRARLGKAAQEGRRVWIVGHIPPGYETYSYQPLWREQYVQSYLRIVEDPVLGDTIAAQLFGHVHSDEFRVLPGAPPNAGPVLLTGSLSPIYNSNPSFRLVEYNVTSGRPLNVRVFWSPLPQGDEGLSWRPGYNFLDAYAPLREAAAQDQGLTNKAFLRFMGHLWSSWKDGGKDFTTYASWYKTQVGNDLLLCDLNDPQALRGTLTLPTKQRYVAKYFCGLNITTNEIFRNCTSRFSLPSVAQQMAPLWDYQEGRKLHWRTVATDEEQSNLEEFATTAIARFASAVWRFAEVQ